MKQISLKLLVKTFRSWLFLALFTIFFVSMVTLLLPIFLGVWIGFSYDISHIWAWVVAYILGFSFASALRVYVFSRFALQVSGFLQGYVKKLLFNRYNKEGNSYSSFLSDIKLIESALDQSASQFIRNGILIIGGLAMMFYTSYHLTFLIFLVLPLCVVPILVCLKGYRKANHEFNEIENHAHDKTYSFMHYALPIWYYNQSSWALPKLDDLKKELFRPGKKKRWNTALVTFLS